MVIKWRMLWGCLFCHGESEVVQVMAIGVSVRLFIAQEHRQNTICCWHFLLSLQSFWLLAFFYWCTGKKLTNNNRH